MWLSHSEKPLKANELCDAMGVEIGSADLNSQNIPTIETLLGCSLGLVIVEASTYTVRLIHYTLKEYLSNNTDLFHGPHSMIAEVCLTYLNFRSIRDLPPIPDWGELQVPFLKYASWHWGTHARKEIKKGVGTLALKLLDRFDEHISSRIFFSYIGGNWDLWDSQGCATGFTSLYCCAYFGIVETTVGLLKMKKWDLNATDVVGNTAILLAVGQGHEDIVKMLLEQEGVNPNTADINSQTPLLLAAEYGEEGIVKLLLEHRDVALNTADERGRTPLLWAAENGDEGIVKKLLEREDIAPDTVDMDFQTPLLGAARNGHEGIVEMLLARGDVAPNTPDNDGRTPLLWAAGNGHEGIVRMFLAREDVTPNAADKDGGKPLLWAAGNGHEGVVRMLLEQEGIAPNTPDNGGRTPLLWAARNSVPNGPGRPGFGKAGPGLSKFSRI